jgi:replication factor C subunit 2/4
MSVPWINKYMPKTIDELIVNKTNFARLKYFIDNKSMPNIIISGESGIGKTATIECIAKNILGDKYKDHIFEFNVLDNRGMKLLFENLIIFCKRKIDLSEGHKIVLLDEADNLPNKMQQLIATIMDKYYHNTRFAFTCNNYSELIESIQSKCTIFKYTRLLDSSIKQKLIEICEIEEIKYTEEGIDLIVHISRGDLRIAINNLYAIYIGFKKINLKNINKICDIPNSNLIINLIEDCKNRNFINAIEKIKEFKSIGYSGNDILMNITLILKKYDNIDEELRIRYIEELGRTCIKINKGNDTNLQLYSCIARICD